jgi:hypothetical protein
MQVTCRCGSAVEIDDPQSAAATMCSFCGLPIRLAWLRPDQGSGGIVLRCFCTAELRLPTSAVGTTVNCHSCGRSILVPPTDESLVEVGDEQQEAPACPECRRPLGENEHGLCEECRRRATAAITPRITPRPGQRRRPLLQPRPQETSVLVRRWLPATIALVALVWLANVGYRSLQSGRPRTIEAAPATIEDVANRIAQWSPRILDAVRESIFDRQTRGLGKVERDTVEVIADPSGTASNLIRFTALVGGIPTEGHLHLLPRSLEGTLDAELDPPHVLVDLLVTRQIGNQSSPAGGCTLTCGFDPAAGLVWPLAIEPASAGAIEPQHVPLPSSRRPNRTELARIAAADAVVVLRALLPILTREIEAQRPGAEILLVTHPELAEGRRGVCFRLHGPHPDAEPGTPDTYWRVLVDARPLTDEIDLAADAPAVPLLVSLWEELPSDLAAGARATAVVVTTIDLARGCLELAPEAERELDGRGLMPSWR